MDANIPAGRLSLVATPIGNLEDITLRALRTLQEADVVLAEDTRHTRKLMTHHKLQARLRAFHGHSGPDAVAHWVEALAQGQHLALVSDAGSPLISDPGSALVRAASEAGHQVESIPGPSAVVAALSVAAIPCDTFRFVGFLPRSGKRRRNVIQEIASERGASVLFEAPNRLLDTLQDLEGACGADRIACVCRELTKLHETKVRGSLEMLIQHFQGKVRGEITLVVAGAEAPRNEAPADLDARIDALLAENASPRDVARQLHDETGLPRRDLYTLIHQRAKQR